MQTVSFVYQWYSSKIKDYNGKLAFLWINISTAMRDGLGEIEREKLYFWWKRVKDTERERQREGKQEGRKHCHLLFSPPLLRLYGELIPPYASRVTLQFNLLCGAPRPAYLRIAGWERNEWRQPIAGPSKNPPSSWPPEPLQWSALLSTKTRTREATYLLYGTD